MKKNQLRKIECLKRNLNFLLTIFLGMGRNLTLGLVIDFGENQNYKEFIMLGGAGIFLAALVVLLVDKGILSSDLNFRFARMRMLRTRR